MQSGISKYFGNGAIEQFGWNFCSARHTQIPVPGFSKNLFLTAILNFCVKCKTPSSLLRCEIYSNFGKIIIAHWDTLFLLFLLQSIFLYILKNIFLCCVLASLERTVQMGRLHENISVVLENPLEIFPICRHSDSLFRDFEKKHQIWWNDPQNTLVGCPLHAERPNMLLFTRASI